MEINVDLTLEQARKLILMLQGANFELEKIYFNEPTAAKELEDNSKIIKELFAAKLNNPTYAEIVQHLNDYLNFALGVMPDNIDLKNKLDDLLKRLVGKC